MGAIINKGDANITLFQGDIDEKITFMNNTYNYSYLSTIKKRNNNNNSDFITITNMHSIHDFSNTKTITNFILSMENKQKPYLINSDWTQEKYFLTRKMDEQLPLKSVNLVEAGFNFPLMFVGFAIK